jgi:hypothetical protein
MDVEFSASHETIVQLTRLEQRPGTITSVTGLIYQLYYVCCSLDEWEHTTISCNGQDFPFSGFAEKVCQAKLPEVIDIHWLQMNSGQGYSEIIGVHPSETLGLKTFEEAFAALSCPNCLLREYCRTKDGEFDPWVLYHMFLPQYNFIEDDHGDVIAVEPLAEGSKELLMYNEYMKWVISRRSLAAKYCLQTISPCFDAEGSYSLYSREDVVDEIEGCRRTVNFQFPESKNKQIFVNAEMR